MVRWLPSFRPKPPSAARAPAPTPAVVVAPLAVETVQEEEPVDEITALAFAPARPGAGYRIESYSRTHEGRVRTHNEDSYVARDDAHLWAVADGMGGHEGGEWASGRIAKELERVDLAMGFEDMCEEATAAVIAANKQIIAEGRKRGKSMGSTLVMLVIDGVRYAVIWAGDSRAYLMRGGTLERLSRDHTQVQEMVTRGLMTAEQAKGHPMGHVLSRAIGVQAEVEIEQVMGEIQPGDIFLLCSDGLHGVVGEETIGAHFCRAAPDTALDELIDLTLEKGAPDNVTGIAIWISEPTLLSFAETQS